MRERRCLSFFRTRELRITPARAGKTVVRWQKALIVWDHPRSCGKDCVPGSVWPCVSGSPPLVRERQIVRTFCNISSRITPARAGKTCYLSILLDSFWDHPRSYGKDGSPLPFNAPGEGSPPLVRERRWQTAKRARKSRITPARAGKTRPQLSLCKWR